MATKLRTYFAEFVVVFVGVALAFAVENLREDLNDRAVGQQYLEGFREDLLADLGMLQALRETREAQLENAMIVLEFFGGRAMDPQAFFEAYSVVTPSWVTTPNRSTMDEVLSSGSLRLIRDAEIRSGLLRLYATYESIAHLEEHVARDYDAYLYDPTFSSIPLRFEGPWPDTAENRQHVEILLNDVRVENGVRLVVINFQYPDSGLIAQLESAMSQVEHLLEIIPSG